jgi:hypothetical protein
VQHSQPGIVQMTHTYQSPITKQTNIEGLPQASFTVWINIPSWYKSRIKNMVHGECIFIRFGATYLTLNMMFMLNTRAPILSAITTYTKAIRINTYTAVMQNWGYHSCPVHIYKWMQCAKLLSSMYIFTIWWPLTMSDLFALCFDAVMLLPTNIQGDMLSNKNIFQISTTLVCLSSISICNLLIDSPMYYRSYNTYMISHFNTVFVSSINVNSVSLVLILQLHGVPA